MHTINPGIVGLPRSIPIMKTYDRIQAAFPGGPQPAAVVVQADDVTSPAVQDGVKRMTAEALATRELFGPVSTTVSPNRHVEIVNIPTQGNGTDKRSEAAIDRLRDDVIPSTIDRVAGTQTNV